MFGLADAVATVDGLVFYCRVPPRIDDKHVIGFGEVQPGAAGFGADQEHADVVVALEVFYFFLPFTAAAVEVFVGDLFGFQAAFDQRQHFDKAGKHQNFVLAGFLFDVFHQSIELNRFAAVIGIFQHGRAVADLAQLGEAFENRELRFADAVCPDFV